jgi:hypothetical protein
VKLGNFKKHVLQTFEGANFDKLLGSSCICGLDAKRQIVGVFLQVYSLDEELVDICALCNVVKALRILKKLLARDKVTFE